ncbi:hypothetical protein DFP73DRAFT_195310 [Morchella snyderi]|nr:hypothetical protein DFP73DRAFT_195310 [Morchella snyderi]
MCVYIHTFFLLLSFFFSSFFLSGTAFVYISYILDRSQLGCREANGRLWEGRGAGWWGCAVRCGAVGNENWFLAQWRRLDA